jgi:histidinol-phosphate phosphatase family protein
MRELVEHTWGWDERWQRRDFDRRFRACETFVIEAGAHVVGGLLLDSHLDSVNIVELQILPAYQGRGIGSAILKSVIDRAARDGFDVTLSIVDANTRARRLYERLGFEVTVVEGPFLRMRCRGRHDKRAVFLDLGGTLVEPLKPERLDELTVIPGTIEAIARLTAAGFVCPVVTVQSRIAKGLFTAEQFAVWFATFAANLADRGASIVGPYVCPHRYNEACPCKKPNSLLYERAARQHGIDVTKSFVVGDSPDDVRAAKRLGAKGCLVRTGWSLDNRVVETAAPDATAVVESLTAAVDWILTSNP